jgi:hypothetical protein
MLSGSCRTAGAAGNRRVLRGGAFNNNQRNARCAYRNHNNPNNRNRNKGFRVAAAHFSLSAQRLAGNVVRLRLDDRGIERKRGLSLAAPASLDAGRANINRPGP